VYKLGCASVHPDADANCYPDAYRDTYTDTHRDANCNLDAYGYDDRLSDQHHNAGAFSYAHNAAYRLSADLSTTGYVYASARPRDAHADPARG
jgi:hypothetical protein